MEGAADSAELWRLTMDYSPVGMALVDLDGKLTVVNRALCEMLGLPADELTQCGFQDVTHPADLDADLEQFRRALAGETDSYRLRKRYLHADGHVVWGDLSVALVRDADGRPLHFVSQILDVTEHRAQEQMLKAANEEIDRERQMLEAIFETVSVGLLLISPDGRYERMNRRHEETMRLPFPAGHDGTAGQLGHVYHLDGTPMSREEMPSYRAAQGEDFDDYRYWVGDDPRTRAAFSTSARQVRGPSGERLGAALAYQEITDLVRAMQVKDEFVSSVSHELRTPLTSVLGHLELLAERDDLPADAARRLRVVQRNARRLSALVADLLQVAQAAEGRLQLRRTRVDLAGLAHEVAEASKPAADRSGVVLSVDAPARLDVLLDEQRIRQVLDNLVSNAVKYSNPGGVVRIAVLERPGAAEVEVSDQGIGIAADELDQVFSRFFRGGEARTRQIPGTGLGLTIVSSIVAAHGGEVTVESEAGRGSTFRVTLPRPD